MEGYQNLFRMIFLHMVFHMSHTMQPNLPMLSIQGLKGVLHIFAKDHWYIHLHNHHPFLQCHLLILKAELFH